MVEIVKTAVRSNVKVQLPVTNKPVIKVTAEQMISLLFVAFIILVGVLVLRRHSCRLILLCIYCVPLYYIDSISLIDR